MYGAACTSGITTVIVVEISPSKSEAICSITIKLKETDILTALAERRDRLAECQYRRLLFAEARHPYVADFQAADVRRDQAREGQEERDTDTKNLL